MLQLEKFSGLRTSEFAFKAYLDKKKILFEILNSMDEKLVCNINAGQFDDLVKKIEVVIDKEEYYFFDKSKVQGDISIYHILHDAIPENRFFHKHDNSKYNNPERREYYPIGISGGTVVFNKIRGDGLAFRLYDFNEKVSGEYNLNLKSEDRISIKRLNNVVKNTL